MIKKPFITARQTDGQGHKIECEDYDDAYEKLSFMLSHYDKWREIYIWAHHAPSDWSHSITVYQDPKYAIQKLREFVQDPAEEADE